MNLSFLVGLVLTFPLFAAANPSPNLSLGSSSYKEDMIYLHVDKESLTAELRTWPESHKESERLMTLRIAIGKAEGDKQVEGDNKTPEGIYFAQTLIDGKTLPAKYGPFAIPINFPNSYDKAQGKTGYGIWLHGVEKDARIEEAKVTEGCVAFYNADIVALSKWLQPQQTVVLISNGRESANKDDDVAMLTQLSKNWMKAWKVRNADQYISHYSSEFKYRRMDRAAYHNYKKRVFSSYKKMNLEFSDLRVFTHQSYAISVMNQDFNGDNRYVSKGRKVLYWKKVGNTWKISHEIFERMRFSPQRYSRELLAKVFEESPSAKLFSKQEDEESKL